MEQRISLVTLGVSDYACAKAFYEGLGWTVAIDVEETAFFQANGSILVLWSRDKLAAESGIDDDGARWGGVTLAHNVGSREAVAEVIALARHMGAEVTREPSQTFYGGVRRCLPRSRRPHLGGCAQSRVRARRAWRRRAPRRLTALRARVPLLNADARGLDRTGCTSARDVSSWARKA